MDIRMDVLNVLRELIKKKSSNKIIDKSKKTMKIDKQSRYR